MTKAEMQLMGGLLHLVQRGKDWAGPQPAQAPPRCTKCNSPSINGHRTKLSYTMFSKSLTSYDKNRNIWETTGTFVIKISATI